MSIKPIKKSADRTISNSNFALEQKVSEILLEIQIKGDTALYNFCEKFDKYKGKNLKVSKNQIKSAYENLDLKVVRSIRAAAERIEQFAIAQKDTILPLKTELSPGVTIGHQIIPISSSASYVPGGRYPLPSSH